MQALNEGRVLSMAESRHEQLYHKDWCMLEALDEALLCSESAISSSNQEMMSVVLRLMALEQVVEVGC